MYLYSALNMLEQDEDLEKVLSESVSQDTIDIGNGGSIDIESLHELLESPKSATESNKSFAAGSGMQFARNKQ